MSHYTIMRCIEIDAGHRVPYHDSKCRNLHGHRYKVEVELTSDSLVSDQFANPESGMLMDFGVLKKVLTKVIDEKYDHGLILWEGDPLSRDRRFEDLMVEFRQKLIVVPVIPTAENLAGLWHREFCAEWQKSLQAHHIVIAPEVKKFRVWETPNSYADYQ